MVDGIPVRDDHVQALAGHQSADFRHGGVAELRDIVAVGGHQAGVDLDDILFAAVQDLAQVRLQRVHTAGVPGAVVDHGDGQSGGKALAVKGVADHADQADHHRQSGQMKLIIFPDVPDFVPGAHLF
ncbi:hypothetical protein CLOSTASPAR_05541 [[Clostridium] asparagiforme DSM 15981]|uniref:Uncharacterized protein n=1 Tax=[Clostridium] asparagiforme DSM 15981 TaxID=518636 RepID=C0D8E3_9FIRM|nr:hypothetical protein CLOSTASPAR_05541 [[Clostridium] asparagiforme DSM 15981]